MAYSIQLPLTAFPYPLFMAFKKAAKTDDDELKEEGDDIEEETGESEDEETEEGGGDGLDFTDSTDGETAFDDEVSWQKGDEEKENDALEGML